jgi:phosphatidate cytidylyltransferase
MIVGLSGNLVLVLLGIFTLLVVATLVILALKSRLPGNDYSELVLRIRTWWAIVAIFAFAILMDRIAAIILLAFVSFLAFKEYISMVPTRCSDRQALFWAYLSIPLQYYWICKGWYWLFIIFIPVFVFLLLPLCMVLIGETKGFLHATGTLHWGLMITVFALSHAAYLLALQTGASWPAGGEGMLLYLVFLTQFNDISQYIWGRLLGRHKVTPLVSPNKTYEGLLGGFITTLLLAFPMAQVLTPLNHIEAFIAGLIIGIGGFIGDINISAIKRDLGIRESGSLLPGHGGVLDRVDSLSCTAPLFFHFVHYTHF